jgi:hypothetical protein
MSTCILLGTHSHLFRKKCLFEALFLILSKLIYMNKLKFTFLFLTIPVFLLSQIIIDQNDMPQTGDTIRLSSTIEYGTLNYEETGNNFTWDFSSLLTVTQKVDTFVEFGETPWIYQLIFWGSSNLAKEMMSFDQYPGFQITDAYEYYKTSSSEFRLVGNAATLNGIPFPNKFDTPDIIYNFPLNAGDIDSSYSYYDIPLTGIGYAGGWKNRVNFVDGWGTLITPYGTFPTLRVKSEVEQYDSIYIDTLGYGIPYLRSYTEYKWLGDGFGEPLCTITKNGPLTTVEYIDSVRNLIIGIPEILNSDFPFTIFPNPVENEIIVKQNKETTEEITISLFDMQGRLIADLCQKLTLNSKGSHSFDLSELRLEPGLYLIAIRTNDTSYLQKIIKR